VILLLPGGSPRQVFEFAGRDRRRTKKWRFQARPTGGENLLAALKAVADSETKDLTRFRRFDGRSVDLQRISF